jgi:hypothetical protein
MMAAANGFSGMRRLQESMTETNGVKGDNENVTSDQKSSNGDSGKGPFRTSSPQISPNGFPSKSINRSLEELESCLNPNSESKANGNGVQANSLEALLD